MKKPFLTGEDIRIAFNIVCCLTGIGTLGMPSNFSRAGPVYGILAFVLMGFANIYACVACSKVMLQSPKSVQTFSDLGFWCMGRTGKYLVLCSHMAVCTLTPCVFLVLGGGLLTHLFPNSFSASVWIILMAISLLPICLKPTLKEGAGIAFAGFAGTFIADIIAIGLLLHGMAGHPPVPAPHLQFDNVIGAFGNLALTFGGCLVIPSLQHEHSQPERMPRVIVVTMLFVMTLCLILGLAGYSSIGCQISGNLLYTIFPDPTTGLSDLGFKPHQGLAIVAFLLFQLHVTIAFAVILHPACFMLERLVLGMHKPQQKSSCNVESGLQEQLVANQAQASTTHGRSSKYSFAIIPVEETSVDLSGIEVLKFSALRIFVVATLVVVAIIFQDRLNVFMDFVGTSGITLCCIILPVTFYLKTQWSRLSMLDKLVAMVVLFSCTFTGSYGTYKSAKELLGIEELSAVKFPYCQAKYENDLYYDATLAAMAA